MAAIRPDNDGVELVVGHSIGSTTGLVCAVEHPGFVRRLICEDGPAGPSTHNFAAIAQKVREWILAARKDRAVLEEEWLASPPEAFLDADGVRAKVAATATADPDLVPAAIAAYPEPFTYAERCDIPVLLMLGVPEHGGGAMVGDDRERFMAALEHGTLVEFGNAGHGIHRQFFDQFADCVTGWLMTTTSQRGG